MGFEKFTMHGRGWRPRVSVRSNGQIGFNKGAVRKYDLEHFPAAVLYYDRDSQAIGIQLTKDGGDPAAVPLRVKHESAWISAKTFLDYYEVSYDRTSKYDIRQEHETGMLTFQVKPAARLDGDDERDDV